jgi:hypothetical protein
MWAVSTRQLLSAEGRHMTERHLTWDRPADAPERPLPLGRSAPVAGRRTTEPSSASSAFCITGGVPEGADGLRGRGGTGEELAGCWRHAFRLGVVADAPQVAACRGPRVRDPRLGSDRSRASLRRGPGWGGTAPGLWPWLAAAGEGRRWSAPPGVFGGFISATTVLAGGREALPDAGLGLRCEFTEVCSDVKV